MSSSNDAYQVYTQIVGGGLKFKSGNSPNLRVVQDHKIKKKKKSNSESSATKLTLKDDFNTPLHSNTNKTSNVTTVVKTKAQLKFEETRKQRQRERIAKLAEKSHKEKVDEFNKHLESLSEHYDIPKVGPG